MYQSKVVVVKGVRIWVDVQIGYLVNSFRTGDAQHGYLFQSIFPSPLYLLARMGDDIMHKHIISISTID